MEESVQAQVISIGGKTGKRHQEMTELILGRAMLHSMRKLQSEWAGLAVSLLQKHSWLLFLYLDLENGLLLILLALLATWVDEGASPRVSQWVNAEWLEEVNVDGFCSFHFLLAFGQDPEVVLPKSEWSWWTAATESCSETLKGQLESETTWHFSSPKEKPEESAKFSRTSGFWVSSLKKNK